MNKYLSQDVHKVSENIIGEDSITMRNVRLSIFYFCNDGKNKEDFGALNRFINNI